MKIRMVLNYVLVTICCCMLIVAVLFLALQWGNTAKINAFGPQIEANVALLIILSALGGFLVTAVLYLLVNNLRSLLLAKKTFKTHLKEVETSKRIEELEKKTQQVSQTSQNP